MFPRSAIRSPARASTRLSFGWLTFAYLRFASRKVARLRFASRKVARLRFVSLRFACRTLVGLTLAFLTLGATTSPAASHTLISPPFFKTIAACANPKLLTTPGLRVDAPKASLRLVPAEDETTRELGLMCVTWIRPHAGMIFVFDTDQSQEFWMKNTLISLDMIWVRADGRVDTVAAHVPASTRATPDDKVARRTGRGRYVIELPSGEARADGITPGSTLTLPRNLVAR